MFGNICVLMLLPSTSNSRGNYLGGTGAVASPPLMWLGTRLGGGRAAAMRVMRSSAAATRAGRATDSTARRAGWSARHRGGPGARRLSARMRAAREAALHPQLLGAGEDLLGGAQPRERDRRALLLRRAFGREVRAPRPEAALQEAEHVLLQLALRLLACGGEHSGSAAAWRLEQGSCVRERPYLEP